MTGKLDPTHYILIGVLALTFMPQFLSTWETRSYENTQSIESKVAALEIKITALEGSFNRISDDIREIKGIMQTFSRTTFENENLGREFETFVQEHDAENLRQWSRINENEENINTLRTRYNNFTHSE